MAAIMCPNYEVSVGTDTFSPKDSGLVSLKVERSIGLPIDSAEILLVQNEDYAFKKGDTLKVKLGYDGKLETIFNGAVSDLKREVSALKVTALSLTASLLRLRINRVYLNQAAGKIVSNIAQEAQLTVKKASDGINLPIYIVDDSKNAYEHILQLAQRSNFNVYITENDQLVFQEHQSGKATEIHYGKEIISINETEFSPLFSGARVYGESPSSIKGSDTSHWLTKEDVKGEAGSGTMLVMEDPALKDNKTAETVAKARTACLECTTGLVIETVGMPQISLGDTITLVNLPNSRSNGNLEVRSFSHYLSKTKGFITKINCLKETGP
jgi:hypothetical protein